MDEIIASMSCQLEWLAVPLVPLSSVDSLACNAYSLDRS